MLGSLAVRYLTISIVAFNQIVLIHSNFFQKRKNVWFFSDCEMTRKGVKETYPQSMRGIKNSNNRERAGNQKDPTPKFRQKVAKESLHHNVLP